jgi:hypothetical protein
MDPDQPAEQSGFDRVKIDNIHPLGAYLRGRLSERLAMLNPAVTLRQCITHTSFQTTISDGPHFRIYADRTLDITYASPESLKKSTDGGQRYYAELYAKAKRYPTIDDFKRAVANVAESVRRIQQNGGQVVFLRMPSTGARLQLEESAFPSRLYFPALASVTSAPWIDFRDLSGAEPLDCPDESHLSPGAARVFTARLVETLERRALLKRPADFGGDKPEANRD